MKQFDRFIHERKYLTNVSPRTIEWYLQSLNWLGTENPTDADLKDCVIRMREAGLKTSSVNNRARAINSYLHWQVGGTTKCHPACPHLRIARLKEPVTVLPTFEPEDILSIAHLKTKSACQRRLVVLLLTVADTGCRIDEVLSFRWADIDFDNLLMTVTGKGSKQRRIPFSFELRKHLTRFKHDGALVFATADGNKLGRRTVHRDCRRLLTKLGVAVPARTLHAFRHSYAVNALRRGSSVFHVQKVLGHSSLDMTRRYANLMTEDLSAVHERASLLNRGSR